MIEWCSETTRVFLYYPFVMRYSSPVRISTKVGKGRGKVKGTICLIKNLDENGLLPQGKTYTN